MRTCLVVLLLAVAAWLFIIGLALIIFADVRFWA